MRCSPLLLLALTGCLPEFPGKTYREDPSHDFDGDGVTEADGDCDDSDPAARPGAVWYRDGDGDLYGDATVSTVSCSIPTGFVADGTDCDDSVSGVHPGVEETCTPFDDDCDGSLVVPEGAAVPTWHLDADADGFGATDGETRTQCDPPAGFVYDATDCDDARADVRPRAPERCDGRDNDCDGATDDADPDASDRYTWYADTDSDGYGASDATTLACDAPAGFVEAAGDCDDTRGDVAPGAAETCDGVDQDCDGRVDDGVQVTAWLDSDGDGFGSTAGASLDTCEATADYVFAVGDCDDLDPTSYPTAAEWCDGIDNDCDGLTDEVLGTEAPVDARVWYVDADGDGHGDPTRSRLACELPDAHSPDADDCDDGRASVNPGATETCATALDDDCDGDRNDPGATGCVPYFADHDGDGFGATADVACQCTGGGVYTATASGDCDDSEARANPGTEETCASTFDDDCDGDTNDAGAIGCTIFGRDEDGDGYGQTDDAACTCTAASPYTAAILDDCDDASAAVNPGATERCDAADVDEDCSGTADDAGAVDARTWYRDLDDDGYGDPDDSRTLCEAPAAYIDVGGDCDDLLAWVNPGAAESCRTTDDDDCDGDTNDADAEYCITYYEDADGDGYGVTATSICQCSADGDVDVRVGGDCDDRNTAATPRTVELCSTTFDDDCDGAVNEANASDCEMYYYDHDGDGYGTADRACLCASTGAYRAAAPGDCDDLDGGVNPGASNCGLVGEVTAASAAAITSGGSVASALEYAGNSFAGQFDYNGDGYDDIVFGLSGMDGTYTDEGGVVAFLGPVAGTMDLSSTTTAPIVFRAGTAAAAYAGDTVSGGDWDGDGLDEIVIGGRTTSWVLEGGVVGGGLFTADDSLLDDVGYDWGRAARISGDANNDGRREVTVYASSPDSSMGVYGASVDGRSRPGDLTVWSPYLGVNGYSTLRPATVDIDGDGILDDYAPVCPALAGLNCRAGPGVLINWQSDAFLYYNYGPEVARYYDLLRAASDVNGDGYDDVLIARRRADGYHPIAGLVADSGDVRVLFGGTSGGYVDEPTGAAVYGVASAMIAIVGDEGQAVGYDATSVDLDGDTIADMVVTPDGAATNPYGTDNTQAWIFYGPITGPRMTSEADAHLVGVSPYSFVTNAGDTNADGFEDLLIGNLAYEGVQLYLGAAR